MNDICHSVHVDGMVILLGGGGDTLTVHAVIKLKGSRAKKTSFQLPLYPYTLGHKNTLPYMKSNFNYQCRLTFLTHSEEVLYEQGCSSVENSLN